MRKRLGEIFNEIRGAITYCLKAAVAAGELNAKFDCEEYGAYMVDAQQGAQLMVKVERDVKPMERLKQVVLDNLAHHRT